MNKAFKIVLMVCAIVLVLAISGSMIYYFAFFIPGNEKAKWEAELEFEKEKLRKEEEQREEEELKETLKELERERKLQNCLDGAYDNYGDAWDSQVERLDTEDDYLPGVTADKLNEAHQKARDDCFTRYGPD